MTGMTAVCYTIGNQGTASYKEALILRDTLNMPIITHYVPVSTPALSADEKKSRDLRVQKWKEYHANKKAQEG